MSLGEVFSPSPDVFRGVPRPAVMAPRAGKVSDGGAAGRRGLVRKRCCCFRHVQQRFLHFYFVNEALNACFMYWLFTGFPVPVFRWASSSDEVLRGVFGGAVGMKRFALAVAVYTVAFFACQGLMLVLLVVRRNCRESRHNVGRLAGRELYTQPVFHPVKARMRDGVEVLARCTADAGGGKEEARPSPLQRGAEAAPKPVMLLVAPLGQQGPAIYAPIMALYGDRYTYVTWDYRGFFGSSLSAERGAAAARRKRPVSPPSPWSSNPRRILSISDHARDGMEVLRACGFAKADVVVGHSMGTAVGMEMALLFPERVGSLILLNGFHGHVYQTAFQPLYRVPFFADCVRGLVQLLLQKPAVLRHVRRVFIPACAFFLPRYAYIFGSPLFQRLAGKDYLLDFMKKYCGGICETEENMRSWLQCFDELDAHSVYHVLPQISQPMLLISGFCDWITPPMQSVEIARRVPHAVHYCDPFSSHASLLESPEWCVAEIEVFLDRVRERESPPSAAPASPGGKDKDQ